MACNDCNDCNDCNETTNPCEETCGCKYEVESLACIRHNGNDLPCINAVKGDTLESIIIKINEAFCEVQSGIDGDDGIDGQSVHHATFQPDFVGEVAGAEGQTDTYIFWGDAAETINLGTFQVHNGSDGFGVDHSAFTSTNGAVPTAGTAGQNDTYTMWGDVAETISLGTFIVHNGSDTTGYDSGWVTISNYNSTDNFGLANFTTGWTQPKIRVVGKVVFLEGYLMIPLSSVHGGTVLAGDVSTYPTVNRVYNEVFSGPDGGFSLIAANTLRSVSPIIPQVLTPSTEHTISSFEMTYRNVQSSKQTATITLSTVLPTVRINSSGRVQITTLPIVELDGIVGSLINSPYNILVTRTQGFSASVVPDYSGYYTEELLQVPPAISIDQRVSPAGFEVYPTNFDGNDPERLGGFRIKLTTSYPLGENITQTQIATAISQIIN